MQHWPWLKKIPLAAPRIAASMSASAKTTFGDLPPSSSETFLRLPAAALTISLPTSVEPVNATLSTSSCAASAAPASPKPVTMLTTPVRQAGLEQQLAEVERRQRRLLGRLEHHRAAAGQRRAELPRRHQQREVPGDDLADDADRLAQRVGEVLARREREIGVVVAEDLRRPARHVVEQVGRQRHVGGPRDPTACRCRATRACASSSACSSIRSPIRQISLPARRRRTSAARASRSRTPGARRAPRGRCPRPRRGRPRRAAPRWPG